MEDPLSITRPVTKLRLYSAFLYECRENSLWTLRDRKWVTFLTRGCDSVLPGGLVVAQGEQHGLDGSDEDPGQAAVENDIEQKNFDCRERKKK